MVRSVGDSGVRFTLFYSGDITIYSFYLKCYINIRFLYLQKCETLIIHGRRIQNLDKYLGFLIENSPIVIGINITPRIREKLEEIGFPQDTRIGDSILPSSKTGKVCEYNAEGKYIPQKHLKMETAYRQVEWHWEEWNGPYDTTEQSKIVDVPYQRYPRIFSPPPSIELSLYNSIKGDTLLVSPEQLYNKQNKKLILHVINMFLEIFGECQVFSKDLADIIQAPTRKLNWRVLPPGRRPWQQLEKELKSIIDEVSKGKKPVVIDRLRTINKYGPDFAAVGTGGFRGYVIMGFQDRNLYVCESIFYGNATYIFDERWEELSRKTKAEILDNNLQTDRIIHRVNLWARQIRKWLA